jgi:ech hydrogenase subunit D
MIENLKEITKDTLLSEVQKFADAKARFVVTVCNDLGDKLEATYYFNYSLLTFIY